ncbi:MAG TPA: alpha/beta fold hydrolase [Polyangiaceae bacterium]
MSAATRSPAVLLLLLAAACAEPARAPCPSLPQPPLPVAAVAPPGTASVPPQPPAPPVDLGVTPVEGDFVLHDFHFTSGQTLPELRIHYTTLGTPARDASGRTTNAVLVLHGTTGSGHQFLSPQFARELFLPGQLLDVRRYYVILPDDIGHGRSSKPSDGLRARFPAYGYHDMVEAEHRLVAESLKVDHLRLVMGTSMGCMHSWMWAESWPDQMDAVMPLACLPVAIAGRNRLWRKLTIDGVRNDPAYRGGDYSAEPEEGLRLAAATFLLAGAAPLEMQKRLATRDATDLAAEELTRKFVATHDANDLVYALSSSGDYDPSRDLEKITAPVMFVNSADDFINPPELGIAETEIRRVRRGKFVLLPATPTSHGHGTHTWAVFWKQYLAELLGG